MSLSVFKCENCGARVPPPPASVKMVVCEFCGNPGHNPFYVPQGAPSPTQVVAQTTAPQSHTSPVTASAAPRTAEAILRLAQTKLQLSESLYYAPAIPPAKERGARASYGARIPADEPILVLYDATVFGGADDGFVITPARIGWKNVVLEPHAVPWEVFDASTVRVEGDAVKVMGDEIQLDAALPLQARLMDFLRAMGGAATASAATASAAPQRPAVGALEDRDEDEVDEATVQGWIDDTVAMAREHLRRRPTLHVFPNIPKDRWRLAFETYADDIEEDDTIVALYDPPGGGADDGFVATPWGFFWRNRGEDPSAVWWEELSHDDVELEDGVLYIDGVEVRVSRQDQGLSDELYAFIEAMIDWAS